MLEVVVELVVELVETVETVETAGRLVAELTDPDDAKLLVLARAHRARAGSDTGAAVRDTDGRTYSAVDIDLTSLRLSALQLAVAVAAGSGVKGLEAAVVVGAPVVGPEDLAAVRDFAGAGVPIHVADVAGQVASSVTT